MLLIGVTSRETLCWRRKITNLICALLYNRQYVCLILNKQLIFAKSFSLLYRESKSKLEYL